MVISGGLLLLGIALVLPLVAEYINLGLRLLVATGRNRHLAVTGLLFIIAGLLTFSSTLVVLSVAMHSRRQPLRT